MKPSNPRLTDGIRIPSYILFLLYGHEIYGNGILFSKKLKRSKSIRYTCFSNDLSTKKLDFD